MVGSSPHRAGSHQPEPARSQQQGNFPNPKRDRNEENGRFREESVNTTQTGRSHSRVDSHVSPRQNDEQAMPREINDLKRKLRHAQRRRSHPNPDFPSDDESDDDYRQRSRTPPSETFSHEEEHHQRRKRKSPSPRGLGHDAMNRALDQLSKSPFTHRIEGATLPRRFQQPAFPLYSSNTDRVEHVSQFNQRMAIHSKNEALMCKVFPSNLGPVAMRWFNGLKENSVDSYRQLTQAFGSRFVTNSRAPRPLSALLSLSMCDRETLKAYSGRYWEMYNKMDGNFDDVTINIFKNSLPAEHGLRKSLTGKLAASVHQLMDRIDKYKWVKEDQLQGKGNEKIIS